VRFGVQLVVGMISFFLSKNSISKPFMEKNFTIKKFNKGQIIGGLIFWFRLGYY
jgi:hypothetical protein